MKCPPLDERKSIPLFALQLTERSRVHQAALHKTRLIHASPPEPPGGRWVASRPVVPPLNENILSGYSLYHAIAYSWKRRSASAIQSFSISSGEAAVSSRLDRRRTASRATVLRRQPQCLLLYLGKRMRHMVLLARQNNTSFQLSPASEYTEQIARVAIFTAGKFIFLVRYLSNNYIYDGIVSIYLHRTCFLYNPSAGLGTPCRLDSKRE